MNPVHRTLPRPHRGRRPRVRAARALAAKLFGLDIENNPQGPYLARLFGSREIAIGTVTLLARGKTRRNLVLAGIGVDAADAATGVLGIQDKSVPVRTGAMLDRAGDPRRAVRVRRAAPRRPDLS